MPVILLVFSLHFGIFVQGSLYLIFSVDVRVSTYRSNSSLAELFSALMTHLMTWLNVFVEPEICQDPCVPKWMFFGLWTHLSL